MQGLDIVFLVLLILLTLRTWLKGFSGEVLSIASLALGIIGAVLFFRAGAVFLRKTFMPADMAVIPEILAFIIIFLIVFILGKIIEHIVKDILSRLDLSGLDRVLGFILGFIEGLALICLCLFLLRIQPLFDSSGLLGTSIFARLLLPLIGFVAGNHV